MIRSMSKTNTNLTNGFKEVALLKLSSERINIKL